MTPGLIVYFTLFRSFSNTFLACRTGPHIAAVWFAKVSMTRNFHRKICSIVACAFAALLLLPHQARSETDSDLQTLEMFYEGKDLTVSATRSPKPLAQTAENITVVTAAEIETMGAHTVLDVLQNVSGLMLDDERGSLGTWTGFSIQGAAMAHILVLLDGVTLNLSNSNFADLSTIPVQIIERIEIVKGAGSSSWGPARGGVINIVTKAPNEDKNVGGTLSFSAGGRGTRDSQGEVSGTTGQFGYYLYAGNLVSSGLSPHTSLDLNNLYGKFKWDLPQHGSLLFTVGYTWQSGGNGQSTIYDLSTEDRKKNFLSSLSYSLPLSDRADIELSVRTASKRLDDISSSISTGVTFPKNITRESDTGGSAKFTWRGNWQTLAMGTDYDYIKSNDGFNTNVRSDKWGVFLNDTISIGPLAVTPGIRYDRMNLAGDFTSPSLGVAWKLDEQTVLRAYAGRGYSLPLVINFTPKSKVTTLQAGFETTHIPYLWLKTTYFMNYLETAGYFSPILAKQQRQGIEVEGKSLPIFNTSLSADYTFIDAKNQDTGQPLPLQPRQIVKMGIKYDDKQGLRVSLLGRYAFFSISPKTPTKDKAVIWDLNLAKKVYDAHATELELFFNAHNLFNGAQYNSQEGFRNPRRWLEGGFKFSF